MLMGTEPPFPQSGVEPVHTPSAVHYLPSPHSTLTLHTQGSAYPEASLFAIHVSGYESASHSPPELGHLSGSTWDT